MRTHLLCALAVAALTSPAMAAAPCTPALAASLDIHTEEPFGAFTVPVTINDQERRMYLSLSPHTSVARGFLKPEDIETNVRGRALDQPRDALVGKITSLKLGGAVGTDLYVDAIGYQPGPDAPVGTIGTGILANFDLELDLAGGKVNLFAPEACAGGGVHWATQYAVLPLDMDTLRKATVAMTLDGKPVTVSFNLARLTDGMPVTSAAALFGLEPGSFATADHRSDDGDDEAMSQLTLSTHRFAKLAAGDFALDGLTVQLTGASHDPVCDGKTKHSFHAGDAFSICFGPGDLELGLTTLRRLHLYFAFKEHRLYVTPAAP